MVIGFLQLNAPFSKEVSELNILNKFERVGKLTNEDYYINILKK